MKKISAFTAIKALFILLLSLPLSSVAQEPGVVSLQQMVDSGKFIFRAQSANPQRGGMRQLTSAYDLRIKGDSIVSFLPYFGRAFNAPVYPTESPLQFTSTDFTYTVKKKKKGWDITVIPKDTREVRQFVLNISTSGYARLSVLSNNRDGISFNGVIEEVK